MPYTTRNNFRGPQEEAQAAAAGRANNGNPNGAYNQPRSTNLGPNRPIRYTPPTVDDAGRVTNSDVNNFYMPTVSNGRGYTSYSLPQGFDPVSYLNELFGNNMSMMSQFGVGMSNPNNRVNSGGAMGGSGRTDPSQLLALLAEYLGGMPGAGGGLPGGGAGGLPGPGGVRSELDRLSPTQGAGRGASSAPGGASTATGGGEAVGDTSGAIARPKPGSGRIRDNSMPGGPGRPGRGGLPGGP